MTKIANKKLPKPHHIEMRYKLKVFEKAKETVYLKINISLNSASKTTLRKLIAGCLTNLYISYNQIIFWSFKKNVITL